ncbi:hypothetical protein AciX8_0958 [Granulicella mallensis MP5ACTX8]|uniref:Uncharacterized protein n=1 Tax=Granulicella mallensis (strain ATCC BAA-1857 / DSM 23137 / MP5ACTX8) TaxID=682795 RepID=G8NUF0_GRAMM|nr:hypothetical protein AciX8_0958 [Granulicella mallensis MP5ACTX8]
MLSDVKWFRCQNHANNNGEGNRSNYYWILMVLWY